MMKKYAFEYEKVILQGGISVKNYVGIRRVNRENSLVADKFYMV